jgi:hypothetical protein
MSPARCITRRAKRSSATLHILRASIADAALNAGIIMSVASFFTFRHVPKRLPPAFDHRGQGEAATDEQNEH